MIPGETILSAGTKGKDPHVSDFQVMQSNGWYIGTVYTNCGECEACKKEDMWKGFSEPNSRETGYFKTEQAAKDALDHYNKTGYLTLQRT